MNLNPTKSLGMLLLGFWLIVTGLLTVLSVGNPIVHVLLALFAVAAGVFILLAR
jgi:hypothetical protein